MTFVSLMQNELPNTLKPEVKFQYGGRLFFQTENSNISALNGDMSTRFGLLIDLDLLKAETSTNTKPEVVLSGPGRHLDKWVWRHTSAVALHESSVTPRSLTRDCHDCTSLDIPARVNYKICWPTGGATKNAAVENSAQAYCRGRKCRSGKYGNRLQEWKI